MIDFKYKIEEEGINEIIDEKNNTIIALRKVSWGNGPSKLELRKWYINEKGETPNKGFSFLTEEGPNNLVSALLKNGFGENKVLLDTLKERLPEYKKQLSSIKVKDVDKKDNSSKEEQSDDTEEVAYFDPSKLLNE